METTIRKASKINQSITFKAMVIGVLTLILLIPGLMIQDLIRERQDRSIETIEKINAKWSNAQTFCGPVLSIPYTTTHVDSNNKTYFQEHVLTITPGNLTIDTRLFPEERYYGIYKTILYKSETDISGNFDKINFPKIENGTIHWDQAYMAVGVSDLRGITDNIDFKLENKQYTVETTGNLDTQIGKMLAIPLNDPEVLQSEQPLTFKCQLKLNGSSNINFIPIGKTTKVHVAGNWKSPGFIGNFTPDHTITENGFEANWSILSFNRSIPEMWTDGQTYSFEDSSFGVNLVDPVNHYQQNMRSAKYAIMFIALTFVVFFFVEILTGKRIHPIQYLLVGLALILFYSLLLSISEQINFGIAYLIASIATIGLITAYTYSIFRNRIQTGALTGMLCLLYIFLYVVLQLEDVALLIGSIGLFVILGTIMFFSRKISWYKQEDEYPQTE
ncbi:cell envelope integrity protein CreD [Parabacteroides faecis]|uniref:Inner membrane protein n=1 Tax=Parabacteroides faecis TaxID=1217282 RepID=A0ABR6KRD8_9BACT|nr:cell envelope integrity protein CreD [Parabacteroides faecis]MBB4624010.1 inner membrane protein [Parabacteroides faecis]GGK07108.1 cell envelope integrity protein CreD [Parabacteroides faecis]